MASPYHAAVLGLFDREDNPPDPFAILLSEGDTHLSVSVSQDDGACLGPVDPQLRLTNTAFGARDGEKRPPVTHFGRAPGLPGRNRESNGQTQKT